MKKNSVKTYCISLKHFLIDKLSNQPPVSLVSPIRQYSRLVDLVLINIKGNTSQQDLAFKLLRSGVRLLKTSLLTFCVVNTGQTVVGYPACIFGKSMQPEFNSPTIWTDRESALKSWKSSFFRLDLDWVWVSCWQARHFSFARGDIVVFVSPKEPYDYVIKRVIGLEGDTVTSHQPRPIKVKIPEGHCWVEGDNWNNSVDSNKYGPISKGLIFGVATHVIWPTHKWRRLVEGIPAHLVPSRVEGFAEQHKPR